MYSDCMRIVVCLAAPALIVASEPFSASTEARAEGEQPALTSALEAMPVEGPRFDPQPIVDAGVGGMRGVLDRYFPETAAGAQDQRKKVQRLIGQLGDDAFDRREQAAVELRRIGRSYQDLLRSASEGEDAEIRFRAAEILRSFQRRTAVDEERRRKSVQALEKYLTAVDNLACQQELADRVAKALAARLDQTPKAQELNVCLAAMANWKVDLVHEELLPLLKHEDPAVAIFAMRGIAGRTGNSYIAPIHMGAIASGRRELVKSGLRCMPCPIWDRKNKPLVREVYVKIFDAADPQWDFSDDDAFMQTAAFVAARDFHIEKARDWLLRRMANDDDRIALRSIQALGDTYYMRRPIYPQLLEALGPHLASEDAKFRAAAVYTVGVYQGDPVPALLLQAFSDANERVWQTAGRRLADQHRYHRKGESPIPKLLADAIEQSNDEQFKARATFLLKHIQKDSPGYLQWPE